MAKNKARAITQLTIKRLYALSGNTCAFPNCDVKFFEGRIDINVSNICHIEAAEHGGERFNPDSNPDYRRSYENLILLCPNHHVVTNDTKNYTSERLKQIKRNHEINIQNRVKNGNSITKYPTTLGKVVNLLGSENLVLEDTNSHLAVPDPEEKILYNNIKIYKQTIEYYKAYQGKLNKIYTEIENQGSNKKDILIRNINTFYLKEKGKHNNFNDIRANADDILKNIETELLNIIDKSDNIDASIDYEAILMSINIIIIDAFLRCEILEEPPKK